MVDPNKEEDRVEAIFEVSKIWGGMHKHGWADEAGNATLALS
jgi:hypothetical protein